MPITATPVSVMKRWIEALRNGKYKQGNGMLRNENRFCCLGVLCDLSREDGGDKWTKQEWGSYEYQSCGGFAPTNIANFVGITENNQGDLASMNDGGATFEEIAKVLEEKFLPRLEKKAQKKAAQ